MRYTNQTIIINAATIHSAPSAVTLSAPPATGSQLLRSCKKNNGCFISVSVTTPRCVSRLSEIITIWISAILLTVIFSFSSGTCATADTSDVPVKSDTSVGVVATRDTLLDTAGSTTTDTLSVLSDTLPDINSVVPAVATVPSDSVTDSLLRKKRSDSLLTEEAGRRDLFRPHRSFEFSTDLSESDFFRADASSMYDIYGLKLRSVLPRTGIAGHCNRLLMYGNTAPLSRIFPGTNLIFQRALDPFYGSDASFPTEYSSISGEGDGTLHYRPHTNGLVSPEAAIFWENGVFDETILSVRFSRPFSRKLLVNVFSNYRYFEGTNFSHDGNDVYTIFSNITSDMTLLSHKGYNPLVHEYFCGANAVWTGNVASSFFHVKYGDLTNEIALDRPPQTEYIDHARVTQYPLSFQAGIHTHAAFPFFFRLEGRHQSNVRRWTFSVEDENGLHPRFNRFSGSETTGGSSAGVRLFSNDSASIRFTATRKKINVSDSVEINTFTYRPAIRWHHPLTFNKLSGNVALGAGYDVHLFEEIMNGAPIWYGKTDLQLSNLRLYLFVEQEDLHALPYFDSLATAPILHDNYLRSGMELQYRRGLMMILTGYQWCSRIDTTAVQRTWLSQTAPYHQPQSAFIFAPQFGRWKGLALISRCMVSDTRPHIKLHGTLSYCVFPKLTREAIDLRLGCDYWSRRGIIYFAGRSDWCREVVDLNFMLSVHIKSFRLFYKIDNLLNRNFSYVPGYFSPGITFRWGFNWAIQR